MTEQLQQLQGESLSNERHGKALSLTILLQSVRMKMFARECVTLLLFM